MDNEQKAHRLIEFFKNYFPKENKVSFSYTTEEVNLSDYHGIIQLKEVSFDCVQPIPEQEVKALTNYFPVNSMRGTKHGINHFTLGIGDFPESILDSLRKNKS